jgi:cysteine desulfurase/selenocysteine lyase
MIPNSKIDYIKVNSNFQLDYDTMPDEEYDIASFTHISNVTGTRIDIEALKNTVRSRFLILDAAQSIAHTEIDVKKLNVDSMAFSGHKMFGPTGIGVLYVKKELGEKLNPFNFGGGMIREVEKVKSTWAPIPEKFEAGTPPIAQAIALGAAIDFINMIGFDLIEQHETELKNYALQKLKEIKEVQIFHEDQNPDAGAVISFTVGRTHSHDISQFLGDREVCVRAGHHCTQILHREILQVPASARLSLSIYNTKEDIDKFIEILKEAISFYQKKF